MRSIVDAYRQQQVELGFELVAGVDEAGRGALAGPVVAAAVILPDDCTIEGIRDSKLIPEPERERLYEEIVACSVAWSVGVVSEQVIDEINILQATFVAMRDAVCGLDPRAEYALIDGRDAVDVGIPCRAIIDGDYLCPSIAAASIIAKVTRDRIMRALGEQMPHFGFASNKGYGTSFHRVAIIEHGPANVHRRTFLRKLLGPDILTP